jgi:hypothetical protein
VKFLFLAECTEPQADEAMEAMVTYIRKEMPEQSSAPKDALVVSSGLSIMYYDYDSQCWKKKTKMI